MKIVDRTVRGVLMYNTSEFQSTNMFNNELPHDVTHLMFKHMFIIKMGLVFRAYTAIPTCNPRTKTRWSRTERFGHGPT